MRKDNIIELATYIGVGLAMWVVSPLLGKFIDSFYFHYPNVLADSILITLFGACVVLLGTALVVWTILLFKTKGHGTPNPKLPPKAFVISGPYKLSRNPMALGGLLALLGEAIVYYSPSLLGLAILFGIIVYFNAKFIEEPELNKRFGESYNAYLKRGPRFFPSPLRCIKFSERFLYKNREQPPPKFSASKGIIYPFFDRIFCILRWFSCLTYIQRKNKWAKSRIVTDLYVISWFLLGWIIVVILNYLYYGHTPDTVDYFPDALKYLFTILLGLRFIDIVQAWWTISFVPKLQAKVPRVIFLVLINYIEMAVMFGVVGYLYRLWPYYVHNKNQSLILIWDALRASVGTLTPLGIADKPIDISSAGFFYFEYAVGLVFLVVIVNVIIAYLTRDIEN